MYATARTLSSRKPLNWPNEGLVTPRGAQPGYVGGPIYGEVIIRIDPGTLPVENATEAGAGANLPALIEGVAEHGDWLTGEVLRDPQADRDGRFGYLLPTVAGDGVRVLTPGIDLSQLTDAQRLRATAPCIYIQDTPWWRPDAVGQTAHAAEAAALAGAGDDG